MPKEDVDNGDLDDFEREIEEFKRWEQFIAMLNNCWMFFYLRLKKKIKSD